ncbi:MAG: hypothetical protein WCY09_05380 [Candidatus Omnitrophota bacterium]
MSRTLSFIVAWLAVLVKLTLAQDLVWEDLGRDNLNIQVVLVNPLNARVIFAGVPGNILKSDNAGKMWRSVLALRNSKRNINVLAVDVCNPNIVYASTDNGLYRSDDLGSHWERIFRGTNDLENQCTALHVDPKAILVGTKSGLFISRDNARSWQKNEVGIGKNVIFNIDASPKSNTVIYLSAVNGIFRSKDTGVNWERIFIGYHRENINDELLTNDSVEEKASDIRFVKAGINNINLVYFATTKGIYKSLDQGQSWEKLGEYGLLNRDIKMLGLTESSQVFALSSSGVFTYQNSHWLEVSVGLAAGKFNYLVFDSKPNIYVAAEKGIFKSDLSKYDSFSRQSLLQEYLKYEPKIKDVQQAAIKYAEVDPEKIIGWRNRAAKKALLPQVNVGLDRNSTDLWHWEGGSTIKADDDTLRKGQDTVNWGVTLSWDFSDLIWTEAQTSIDVRSKLMVELRDDILDQVNKLYFERLRVKSELDNLAIEDRNKKFDKQLKLEELTASLDSLTAGYYSAQLRQLALKE